MRLLSSLLIVAALMVARSAGNQTSYEGYKVYRFHCQNEEQVKLIHSFEEQDSGFDIWNMDLIDEDMYCDVMIAPESQLKYTSLLKARNVRVEVLTNNVQDLIEKERKSMENAPRNSIINTYARYGEMNSFLSEIASANPDIAKLYSAGRSFEGRELRTIILSSPTPKTKRVWIDCGIHAREWVSPSSCIYMIDQLVKEYRANVSSIVRILNKYEVHILPSLNPDGYEYSFSTTRLWRKNRNNGYGSCVGVDLNRNFDARHLQGGSSTNPCTDTFAGTLNSEPETKALLNTLNCETTNNWDAYITIHSYGNWLLLPYGYNKANPVLPNNYNEIERVGLIGAAAYTAKNGQRIRTGNSAVLLYVTTGSSSDYAREKCNIPYSYTFELSPGQGTADDGFGFELPVDRMPKVSSECYAGVTAILDEVARVTPN